MHMIIVTKYERERERKRKRERKRERENTQQEINKLKTIYVSDAKSPLLKNRSL